MDVYLNNARVRLSPSNLLGEGGEARVYRWRDRAVKIFHTPSPQKAQKLAAFPQMLPPEVVAPQELAFDRAHELVGYAMPAVLGREELARLSNRRWREGAVSNTEVVDVFTRLADLLSRLHATNVVVGDLNDGNVLFAPGTSHLCLIDSDSLQFPGFACTVAHERTLDPKLYGKPLDFDAGTDWYAWNVLLFSSLLYVHPYGGVHKGLPTPLRRGEARHSVLRSDVAFPKGGVHFKVLSDDALQHFTRVFDGDEARTPTAPLQFTRCSCGLEHARAACPECHALGPRPMRQALRSNGRCTARVIFSTEGRVLEASMRGGARYVYEEQGRVRREDGSLVLDSAAPFGTRFAIDRAFTWVGDRHGRLSRVQDGRTVERASTGVRGTDPVFTSTYRLEQEWVIEHSSGSRVGQILEGQTCLWSGERLGLGFYRLEDLTHVFLVRPGKSGLIPVRGSIALRGRLVDASCVFDDAHSLLCVVIERDGRDVSQLWLIDSTGKLVGQGEGRGGGRALLAGRVLCATDEGLLSLKNDNGVLVEGTLFPDSRAFVGADDTLLPQPDGSLIVVSADEIVHLSLS